MKLTIKELLAKKGKKAVWLANEIGITDVNTRNIINGVIDPKMETLEKIASALNVPVWQLFVSPEEIEKNKITALIKYNGQLFEVHTIEELKQFAASL